MIPTRVRAEHRLDRLFEDVSREMADAERQAHWAAYLCVLVAGYLEVSIREVLSEYCQLRGGTEIASYATSSLRRFQNPRREDIVQLLHRFSSSWVAALDLELPDGTLEQVDSVVLNRHRVAHGDSVTLGYQQVKSHFQSAKHLIRCIERICGA